MSVKQELLKEIQKQREKGSSEKKFSGDFLDYVEHVKKHPDVVKTSHKRLYGAIEKHGYNEMADSDSRKYKLFGNENIKVYNYFTKQFFGMERVLSALMGYLKSAAHKGEESKQVLLLIIIFYLNNF